MARSRALHNSLRRDTLAGAIKLRCEDLGVTLTELAPVAGIKPDTIRARLSKSRGKRALQPWQIDAIAKRLRMPAVELHRLAAKHEGWRIDESEAA